MESIVEDDRVLNPGYWSELRLAALLILDGSGIVLVLIWQAVNGIQQSQSARDGFGLDLRLLDIGVFVFRGGLESILVPSTD